MIHSTPPPSALERGKLADLVVLTRGKLVDLVLVAMCFKHALTRADFLQILGRWIEVAREVIRAPHGTFDDP